MSERRLMLITGGAKGIGLEQLISDWRSMFANHLDSVFYTARFGEPHMIEAGWGL